MVNQYDGGSGGVYPLYHGTIPASRSNTPLPRGAQTQGGNAPPSPMSPLGVGGRPSE